MFYNCIDDHDGCKADDGLVEGRCCCHTKVRVLKQGTEYISIDNVCLVEELSIVSNDLIEHLEVTTKDTSYLQKKHGNDGWKDARDGDVTDSLKNVCSVDRSCLVNLGIYTGNCCNVDNGIISTPFP